jgi:hypothetical protein
MNMTSYRVRRTPLTRGFVVTLSQTRERTHRILGSRHWGKSLREPNQLLGGIDVYVGTGMTGSLSTTSDGGKETAGWATTTRLRPLRLA